MKRKELVGQGFTRGEKRGIKFEGYSHDVVENEPHNFWVLVTPTMFMIIKTLTIKAHDIHEKKGT